MAATGSVLRWYQVVIAAGSTLGPDVRARVQARSADAALRAVMRANRLAFAPAAFIWRLGRSGAPVQRGQVRCRLPRAKGVR